MTKFQLKVGSRAQVMHGIAEMTGGRLTKNKLKYNKRGKIVSKKASKAAKKLNKLVKCGYITKKGVFGVFNYGGASYGLPSTNLALANYAPANHASANYAPASRSKNRVNGRNNSSVIVINPQDINALKFHCNSISKNSSKLSPYNILGIKQSATEKQIKTQFRRMSLKIHPNKQKNQKGLKLNSKIAQEIFKKVSNAKDKILEEKNNEKKPASKRTNSKEYSGRQNGRTWGNCSNDEILEFLSFGKPEVADLAILGIEIQNERNLERVTREQIEKLYMEKAKDSISRSQRFFHEKDYTFESKQAEDRILYSIIIAYFRILLDKFNKYDERILRVARKFPVSASGRDIIDAIARVEKRRIDEIMLNEKRRIQEIMLEKERKRSYEKELREINLEMNEEEKVATRKREILEEFDKSFKDITKEQFSNLIQKKELSDFERIFPKYFLTKIGKRIKKCRNPIKIITKKLSYVYGILQKKDPAEEQDEESKKKKLPPPLKNFLNISDHELNIRHKPQIKVFVEKLKSLLGKLKK